MSGGLQSAVVTMSIKARRGRPRKYGRPSRVVTLTLPEDILARLSAVDADIGRAIVTLVDRKAPARGAASRPAEIASYGNHAVIVVTPIKALKRLKGVELVPIGNGRALISLQQGHSIPQLELDLRDAIEGSAGGPDHDALEAIADILRRARGARALNVEARTIIVLEARRRRS